MGTCKEQHLDLQRVMGELRHSAAGEGGVWAPAAWARELHCSSLCWSAFGDCRASWWGGICPRGADLGIALASSCQYSSAKPCCGTSRQHAPGQPGWRQAVPCCVWCPAQLSGEWRFCHQGVQSHGRESSWPCWWL